MTRIIKTMANKKFQRLFAITLIVITCLFPIIFKDATYFTLILCTLGIYIVVNTGFDVLYGLSGQISIGQAAFYAIGAYTSALLSKAGVPVIISILAGAILAMLIGLVLARPCSKLEHHFLAMVTIGFGEIIRLLIVNLKFTGYTTGILNIPEISFFGLKLDSYGKYLYFVLIVVILGLIVKRRITHSRVGRALIAVKSNPDASEAFGIKIPHYKSIAFGIASCFAGLGGAMYTHLICYISPDSFTIDQSITFLVMLLIGGAGTITGPIIGSALVIITSVLLQQFGSYQMMIYGALIIFILFAMPNGIAGSIRGKYYHLFNKTPMRPGKY